VSGEAAVLYDRECGFCRWALARILRRDRMSVLRPVAIQSAEGKELLAALRPDQRMASWHLAFADGGLYSGDAAVRPLLRLLENPPEPRLVAESARLLGHAAKRPRLFARFVSRVAQQRADELIALRSLDATFVPDRPERAEPDLVPAGLPAAPSSDAGPQHDVPPAHDLAPPPSSEAVTAASTGHGPEHRGWQQRFEESAFGRGILSTLIVVTVLFIVVDNVPDSYVKQKLLRPGLPYLSAVGLDQNWALFAPDPRRVSIQVFAIVAFDDGKTVRWYPPSNGSLIGTYRDYRWRKWEEQITGAQNSVLWRPAAIWAAQRVARPGHYVTRVALIERFTPIEPPGTTPESGPASQHLFYVLNVHGGRLKN
jgi:predicted DCC family thiol-disulfide oxidoreductase YuxK